MDILLCQLDEIGSKSLPLVALAGAAIGAVLSLESRSSLVRFGVKSMLPAALVYSIIHETGPVVTGLVVSGRVGAGIGAELGSMKVTEQIDAIEASGLGKGKSSAPDSGWGTVQIIVYPADTEAPTQTSAVSRP